MAKDKRYIAVKSLIETNSIKSFGEIFQFVPRKIVYNDLGVNYARFKRLVAQPDLFTLRELNTLSGFFGVDTKVLFDLILFQIKTPKKGKPKS